jgi:DNA-binding NtrC family response regulator
VCSILVVDDDKLIRWSLHEIFHQEGCQVDAVATVGEALDHAKNRPYQIIFADVEISQENGIQMLAKIKEFQPAASMIILSALPKSQIEPLLKNLKVFSIIEKPFNSEDIRDTGRKAIKLRAESSGEEEGSS